MRTRPGQEVDQLAFEGRGAATTAATRATDRLLGSITATSLLVLGLVLVGIALARRRPRLAGALVVALGGSIATTELLKRQVLTRPQMPGIGGFVQNTFPSGHATIGTALSLGLVMVVAHRWRWLAAIAAAFVTTAFATGVLTSGWHRPGDVFGAYLVTLTWYCGVMAVLVAWRGPGNHHLLERDVIEEAADAPTTALAGLVVLALLVFALLRSLRADGLRTVPASGWYVVICVLIDVVGIAVVAAYHLLMRDVSPDDPRVTAQEAAAAAVPQPRRARYPAR